MRHYRSERLFGEIVAMNERSIFLAAVDLDNPQERAAYLERACAGDEPLRAQIEELLAAHERPGSFMGEPAPQQLATDLAISKQTCEDDAPSGQAENLDFLAPSSRPG